MKSILLYSFLLPYVIITVLFALLSFNFWHNSRHLRDMNIKEFEFHSTRLYNFKPLADAVATLPDNYAVILLNSYALPMTLNWICNVKDMKILNRTLFFVLDFDAYVNLKSYHPDLHIVYYNEAPSLTIKFKPFDSTYMSFFLMRTNLIQALQHFNKPFWMLQADTIWTRNILDVFTKKTDFDILLDQQGYEGVAESRKKIMNGANFYIPTRSSSRSLVHSWLSWQRWTYITDPDVVKMFCLSGQFDCAYMPHSLVTGWEWIYGDQKNPPSMIQMDGETDGGKEKMLEKYGFWFLDEELLCVRKRVDAAINSINNSLVPRVYSSSKQKQAIVLKLGEWLNELPLFGYYSSVYGGLTSLYLQFFNFEKS